jgi:hypothetical protein
MRAAGAEPQHDETHDVELEHGCILCGGRLELRVSSTGARTYCRACRWISSPQMQRDDDGNVHVVHPAGGIA